MVSCPAQQLMAFEWGAANPGVRQVMGTNLQALHYESSKYSSIRSKGIMSISPESIKQLLSSDDLGDRLRAVNEMRQLEPAIAFDLIQPAIVDPHDRVRYAAVSQMDTLGQQDLQKSLAILRDRLLNDAEADVKAAAADALGGLHLEEAFVDLQQVYHQSSDWIIQLSIIAALGELGNPNAFELLKDALQSSNELIQTTAISALGELGDRRAIPVVVSYTSHPDWQIRYRVVQALNRLDGAEVRPALEVLAGDTVEQIAQLAQSCLSPETSSS